MLSVLTTAETGLWSSYLNLMSSYDFHHTCFYHTLAEKEEGCFANLLVYKKNKYTIVLPLILREVMVNNKSTGYWDATSVYGYAGPLVSDTQVTPDVIESFQEELLHFFIECNIISVFSRLHPCFPFQKRILRGMGDVQAWGKTVSIDLKQASEIQRQQYRKSLKSELNQLRKKHSVTIRSYSTEDDLSIFIKLYYQNMERVGADPEYYFDKDYFIRFFEQDDFISELVLAEKDENLIAGAIFTFTSHLV